MKQKFLLATTILLICAACGSLGDLGGILGSSGPDTSSDVQGTVQQVDLNNRAIILDVNYINNLRQSQTGQTIYWDNNTVVQYQGQNYRPEDLERGDQISIRGRNQSGQYIAETITVTRNVRQ